MGLNGDLKGLHGDLMGLNGDLMGLNGDLMGLNGDLMGLSGDLMGLNGDLMGLNGDLMGLNVDLIYCLFFNHILRTRRKWLITKQVLHKWVLQVPIYHEYLGFMVEVCRIRPGESAILRFTIILAVRWHRTNSMKLMSSNLVDLAGHLRQRRVNEKKDGESATIHFPMPLPTEIAAAVAAFKIEDNGVPVNVRSCEGQVQVLVALSAFLHFKK